LAIVQGQPKVGTLTMIIERKHIKGRGFKVPGIVISPTSPKGTAVIAHGYGGCKEEQLGLAWRVAETGIAACAIDLRGHGQNSLPLDLGVLNDMEAAISHCRRCGPVVALGHSLGGRLALISGADFAIGLSPPLDPSYCARTKELLQKLRSYRVRPSDPDTVFNILRDLPPFKEKGGDRTMIVYGSRDVPEIVDAGDSLRAMGRNAVRIDDAVHGDTYLLESTFDAISSQIARWFP
jgi:pimeloyl-ACP methyl ester carboxylesterase